MPAEREKQIHVWDTYWNFDRTWSFDIQVGSPQQAALERHWIGWLGRLPGNAKVLDIGCGNGAVGIALARTAMAANRPIEIIGIDDAAIDPQQY